jgi:transcription elongation factor Elf1
MAKLKPCPLCGEEVRINKGTDKNFAFGEIHCVHCGLLLTRWGGEIKRLVKDWNKRAAPKA